MHVRPGFGGITGDLMISNTRSVGSPEMQTQQNGHLTIKGLALVDGTLVPSNPKKASLPGTMTGDWQEQDHEAAVAGCTRMEARVQARRPRPQPPSHVAISFVGKCRDRLYSGSCHVARHAVKPALLGRRSSPTTLRGWSAAAAFRPAGTGRFCQENRGTPN